MGNNLAAIAPSQVLPVEQYLQQLQLMNVTSLGSTRFMKVVKAKQQFQHVVLKIFVIHDPKLQVATHLNVIREAARQLGDSPSCLPFSPEIHEGSGFVILRRPYLAANLFDRLNTRPFLSQIERKFITFQLIEALRNAHKNVVRHGDLKLENVLLTSWLWVQISDFATFKPVFLPESNPASFNFYFDSSRRRACNIAPERFREPDSSSSGGGGGSAASADSDINPAELHSEMDVFSLGCVIGQLFAEQNLFDLPKLLNYKRCTGYSPETVVNAISDAGIRELVLSMVQLDPSKRPKLNECLKDSRGNAFPEYFYSFLYNYMASYATPSSPETNITRLSEHYPLIVDRFKENPSDVKEITLILLSLVLATTRSVNLCSSKLIALELLLRMCGHLDSDVILERVVPYYVNLLRDGNARVVSRAISCLTDSLDYVIAVPRGERKLFVEYLFRELMNAVFKRHPDDVVTKTFSVNSVKYTFLKNFARLAETSQRFLDLSIENLNDPESSANPFFTSYDLEMDGLRNAVKQFYVQVFGQASPMMKQLFLESDMVKLSQFFGCQTEPDPLFQYLPTCVSSGNVWQLNESYFRAITDVCVFHGARSTTKNVVTFLGEGLHSTEEFVIVRTLDTIREMFRLKLIEKGERLKLFDQVAPLLLHPNPWVRLNAAEVIGEVCRSISVVDVRREVQPRVNALILPFATQPDSRPVASVTDPFVLLSRLQPMTRACYDHLCSYHRPLDSVLDYGLDITVHGNLSSQNDGNYIPPDFPDFSEEDRLLVQKLFQQSMDGNADLVKANLMRDHLNARRAMVAMNQQPESSGPVPAGGPVTADFRLHSASVNDPRKFALIYANQIVLPETTPVLLLDNQEGQAHNSKFYATQTIVTHINNLTRSSTAFECSAEKIDWEGVQFMRAEPPVEERRRRPLRRTAAAAAARWDDPPTKVHDRIGARSIPVQSASRCFCLMKTFASHWHVMNTRRLEHGTRQWRNRSMDKQSKRVLIKPWKPAGTFVTSLHEHSGPINQIAVSPSCSLFATASSDRTCRIWNPLNWESIVDEPLRQCCLLNAEKPDDGEVTNVKFVSENQVVCSYGNGRIKLCDLHKINAKLEGDHKRTSNELEPSKTTIRIVEQREDGRVVSLDSYDRIVCYSTDQGFIHGWDVRLDTTNNAWFLRTDLAHGLVTSFAVAENELSVIVGTSSGRFTVWDLRFLMPVKTFTPEAADAASAAAPPKLAHASPVVPAVHRIQRHPFDREMFVACLRGNNEVGVWNIESGSRHQTFWASSFPPLEYHSVPTDFIGGFYCGGQSTNDFHLVTGGSDKRIRYIELDHPTRCSVISNSNSSDPDEYFTHLPQHVLTRAEGGAARRTSADLEQTVVVTEAVYPPKQPRQPSLFRRGPELPGYGHRDIITDVGAIHTINNNSYIISSDMSGVVRVWK